VTPVTPVESGQIRMVHNERWRTGMGSSLCAALLALSETGLSETGLSETGLSEVGAAVVALADQPLVGAAAVARLIAAYRDGASVAVAAYDGRPRNPVLLAREHWPEILATATGDQGARAFLRSRADLVTLIECGDTGRPDDIDTAEDLERVARLASEHSASENSASENNASENSGQGREPRIVREKRT